MFHRYFSGFRLSSAAVALLLLTAGLYLGACRSDKGEKTEKTTGTESSAVATSAPSSTETPSGQTGESDKKSAEGIPPEITEPCSGKNEGDACSVIITGGQEIKGTCAMTRRNILGCKPSPIVGHQNPEPSSRPPDLNKNPEKLEDMNK